jgi:hypothetical protein
MFLPPSLNQNVSDDSEPDPAMLAFVKCHVTSLAKWEVLRVLASYDGAWLRGEQLARSTHRQLSEVAHALADLVADGVVETQAAATLGEEGESFRLPIDEPTSVVLRRLIHSATHSQELRAIIAAHLQHLRQQAPAAV